MDSKTIGVFGNSELAAELSCIAALNSDLNILIVDIDTLLPSLDMKLNISKHPKKVVSFTDSIDNTGLNIAIDAVNKNLLSREMLLECTVQKYKNLYVMSGNHNIENYEYMLTKPLYSLVEKAKEIFDIVILSATNFIYDRYTLICMEISDIVLVTIDSNINMVRNTNNLLDYVSRNKGILQSKFKYVLFEYLNNTDLPLKVVKELSGYQIVGIIPFNIERRSFRNKRVPYAKHMDFKTVKQYIKLLRNINIDIKFPKKPLNKRFHKFIKNIKRKVGAR